MADDESTAPQEIWTTLMEDTAPQELWTTLLEDPENPSSLPMYKLKPENPSSLPMYKLKPVNSSSWPMYNLKDFTTREREVKEGVVISEPELERQREIWKKLTETMPPTPTLFELLEIESRRQKFMKQPTEQQDKELLQGIGSRRRKFMKQPTEQQDKELQPTEQQGKESLKWSALPPVKVFLNQLLEPGSPRRTFMELLEPESPRRTFMEPVGSLAWMQSVQKKQPEDHLAWMSSALRPVDHVSQMQSLLQTTDNRAELKMMQNMDIQARMDNNRRRENMFSPSDYSRKTLDTMPIETVRAQTVSYASPSRAYHQPRSSAAAYKSLHGRRF